MEGLPEVISGRNDPLLRISPLHVHFVPGGLTFKLKHHWLVSSFASQFFIFAW
jgi:hypothetical protein